MKKLITLLSIVACSLMISQCSNMSPSQATATDNKSVSVSFAIKTNQQFRQLAHQAFISVSAYDIDSINEPMIITDSLLCGTVRGIPVGEQRKFEIHVYDSSNTLRFYGMQKVSLQSGVSTKVSIPLRQISGPVEVVGYIVDSLYDYDTTHYDTTHYYDTTRGDSGRIVGGNCTYDSIIGKAVVTKLSKIESITESPYYVYFTFSSGTIEKADRIVIPPSRVSRVVIGKEYAAKLFNIKQGTCTPEFYEILEIQRSDENVN